MFKSAFLLFLCVLMSTCNNLDENPPLPATDKYNAIGREEEKGEKKTDTIVINPPEIATKFVPRDTGQIKNGLKEGLWREYFLDTSLEGKQATLKSGNADFVINLSSVLQTNVGTYKNGVKEGIWILSNANDATAPTFWIKQSQTNYFHGQKNDKEFIFNGVGDTIWMRIYVKGILTSTIRLKNDG